MSDLKSDLPYIKWGLLSMLLATAISGTAIFLSQNFLSQSQHAHATADRKLTEARHTLTTATADRPNTRSYTHEYTMLQKRGISGDEQRLGWIDELEHLRQRKLVMSFNYTISPQKPYKSPTALDSGNFDVLRSDMELSFKLLHAGQLINFFDALRSGSNGWFMLDSCTITRNPLNVDHGNLPQLEAKCKGGWLTLKNRNAS